MNDAALYKEEAPYSYLRGFFRFPYGELKPCVVMWS
jgi:hypothetical protein